MTAANVRQDFSEVVRLYEMKNLGTVESTAFDAAYVGALSSIYADAESETEQNEIERKIRETTARIETRIPRYVGGEMILLGAYALKG